MVNLKQIIMSVVTYEKYGCQIAYFKEYLLTFPWMFSDHALIRLEKLSKYFISGNKVDFLSPFSFLISNHLDITNDANPRIGAITLIDLLLKEDPLYNSSQIFKDFEDGQKSKIGPYSIRVPFRDFVEKGPCEYYNQIPDSSYSFDELVLQEAIKSVSSILPEHSVQAESLDEVFNNSDKTTQWGMPYMYKGNDILPEGGIAANLYLELAKQDLARKKLTWYPVVMFMRTQPSGSNIPKQRLTFGVGHSITLLESMLQSAVLKALKFKPQFSENLSQQATDIYISNLFRQAKALDINIIGFDASGYDKSLNARLIRGAFDCIKRWLATDWAWLVDEVQEYLIHCDLITPIGIFVGKNRGIPSGMAFTNLIDSVIQFILHEYVRIKMNVAKEICPIPTFQGDDGVWAIPGLTSKLLQKFMSEFLIQVNPEKVSCSKDYVTFCQRLYIHDYMIDGYNVGIRSAYRTINAIVSYERRRNKDWTMAHDSVRCIMQLVELRNNPVHDKLVFSLCHCDAKIGLGTSFPGGIRGLMKAVGGIEGYLEASSDSSWNKDKVRKLSRRMYQLSTFRILEKILLDRLDLEKTGMV